MRLIGENVNEARLDRKGVQLPAALGALALEWSQSAFWRKICGDTEREKWLTNQIV